MEKQKTQLRQKQIKKAVLQIISTKGLGKLTTRNLAEKVGLTEGALFRHFKSKKEILLSIIDDVKTVLLAEQEKIIKSELKASEKLFEFLCVHVKYLIKNKGITILLFSEATHLDDLQMKNSLFEILSSQKEWFKQIVKQGIKEGRWDKKVDVDGIATMYMGIPVILNIELILNKSGFKQGPFCKKLTTLLERTLRA